VPDGDIVYLLTEMGMGEWLANLPKGLDSVIGVDVTPSGGESSRISLMRAFLHVRNYGPDPLNRVRNTSDLILMDEVTSALDKRTRWLKDDELCTEEKVIKLVESEFKGCTVCIISHEDETSTAFGFRDIVDYEVRLDVRQNGQYEEHHILSAESCNHQAVRESIQRIAK
jgi:ABC-type transport system involved in cytochrome bd biosynthesis fused ATPase/permease subunit